MKGRVFRLRPGHWWYEVVVRGVGGSRAARDARPSPEPPGGPHALPDRDRRGGRMTAIGFALIFIGLLAAMFLGDL